MKQPTLNGKELLPLSVMEAAHAGDAAAMEHVLAYYEGYINKHRECNHTPGKSLTRPLPDREFYLLGKPQAPIIGKASYKSAAMVRVAATGRAKKFFLEAS